METKLFDSELNVMKILWEEGDLPAKEISAILANKIGWNKNTTYTVIKKCIEKGAIERYGKNYMCRPLISKKEVENYEIDELINKVFECSKIKLFASFLNRGLSNDERTQIKKMIDEID